DDGSSQADVARSLGIDRRRVSEKLLLLELPEEVLETLSARADTFTERHARLLAQSDRKTDVRLAKRCAEASWSTRRLALELARHPHQSDSPRLFENVHYSLNKRGGFTLTVRARSSQEVARTICDLESKLAELRAAFETELTRDGLSARADTTEMHLPEEAK